LCAGQKLGVRLALLGLARPGLPTRTVQRTYLARVSVSDTGSFNLKTSTATVAGINHKYCRMIQLGDGYGYHLVSHFQHFIGKQRACSPA
jgi:hypothetical protein